MMTTMPRPRTYVDHRPVVLPASWDNLAGPTRGEIELPLSLGWTGRRHYDLGTPADLRVFCERVLVDSTTVAELASLIDGPTLQTVWAELYLPVQVRSAWEQRFPHLAEVGQVAAG